MPIDFHPAARAEVDAAEAWLAARSPAAAQRFLEELTTALTRIGNGPTSFPFYEGAGFRQAPLMKSGYGVMYRQRAGRIVVVAVAHGRQRPGYWLGRA